MTVAGGRDLMPQLLILCLPALQPVVLVLLGERDVDTSSALLRETPWIWGWRDDRSLALLFRPVLLDFRSLFFCCIYIFFSFAPPPPPLLFTQSLTRKDTTASIHGKAHIEHPLYRRTTILLLPSFLPSSHSPPLLSPVLFERRGHRDLVFSHPPIYPETWIYGFTRSGFAGGGFCSWWVFSRTIWAPCWTARRPAAALKQRSIAISPTAAGFSLYSPCRTLGTMGAVLT